MPDRTDREPAGIRTFDDAPIVIWALYESLLARRAGIGESTENQPAKRVKLCSPFA